MFLHRLQHIATLMWTMLMAALAQCIHGVALSSAINIQNSEFCKERMWKLYSGTDYTLPVLFIKRNEFRYALPIISICSIDLVLYTFRIR
jgi:hypothetical protein